MNGLLTRPEYEALVRRLSGRSILVVGDLMMDEYLLGGATRVSPESPVLVVDVDRQDFKPGGAANVVNNVLAMSSQAFVAGVVGEDECGKLLRTMLTARGAATEGIFTDNTRPTTRKTRVLAHGQQVIRVDRESVAPVSTELADQLLQYVESVVDAVDAILISDYRKGVLTPETARGVISLAQAARKPVVANPKPRSAGWLAGAWVLSLNQLEAEQLADAPLPDDERELDQFGARLAKELDVQTLVITRGARGLSYWTRGSEHRTVPAHAVEVYDVAGAGDTTITAMTLALAAGADEYGAACVANHAGACVVRKRGVDVVTLEEMIDDWDR